MLHKRLAYTQDRRFSDETSATTRPQAEQRHMISEMRAHNLDSIRFSSYRTACKLRFVQKKTHLHLVDIWNIIEAFRENGLNTMDPATEMNVSRLEALICSIYFQLNKRLPTIQQVSIEMCTGLLMNWLLSAYDAEETGKLQVFTVKVALATLCSGKLMDKLRYIFSQTSDSNGHMIASKFSHFLRDALTLPAAVLESPSFSYSEATAASVFEGHSKVTVNNFLDTLMSDPGPHCLVWLPLLHRLSSVENVTHSVQCDACHKSSFSGFRYKCQRCYNYQLCQDCFWREKISGTHAISHEMKEYATFTPGRHLGQSLRKSFRCVPEKRNTDIPRFPEQPEKPLNLSHIVPPSPMPSHNGFHNGLNNSFEVMSVNSGSAGRSPSKQNCLADTSRVDDEHRLIARYAARLAVDANRAARSPSELSLSLDTSRAQRDLIVQLEAKNREIMREIARLRRQQEIEDETMQSQQNPTLLAELRVLRQRKEELEQQLSGLQESRRELMVQLEGLMKLLKNQQTSPRSTPNSSPRSGSSKSPTLASSTAAFTAATSRSAPSTPGGGPPADSLIGVGGDVRLAFGQAGSTRSLRSDLLVAADSVTNAMSSLVKELNEDSDEESKRAREEVYADGAGHSEFAGHQDTGPYDHLEVENYAGNSAEDQELYDSDPHALYGPCPATATTDDEIYVRTDDDESYVKTDDDEAGNTDWEETMKRWINR